MSGRLAGLQALLALGDLATLVVSFAAMSWLRLGPEWTATWDRVLPGWPAAVAVYFGLALAGGVAFGLYRVSEGWRFSHEVDRSVRAVLWLGVLTLGALFLFKLPSVSRLFLVGFFELLLVGMVAVRVAGRQWFRRWRAKGRGVTHVLVVGGGAEAELFVRELEQRPEAGAVLLGYVADADAEVDGLNRVGGLDDLPRLLANAIVDEVVVCLPMQQWEIIERTALLAEEQGKTVRIPLVALESAVSRGRLGRFGGVPVLSLAPTPDHPAAKGAKRALDIVGAAALLLVTGPALVLAALAVRSADGSPAIFRQERVGLHGRPFTIRKLRTMVPDAEALRADLVVHNERTGPVFKLSADPRVTRVGRWLRRTSIDELPQLWNVLKGEMSLVGPRPPMPSEVERYDPWHRRRLSMKPGITGLWQVSARNDADFEAWVGLDLRYIDTWSLRGDLGILARTVPAMLRMTGR